MHIICATVGLCVESANIVGYITPDVKENYAVAIDAFQPVSGGDVDINEIKVSGEGIGAGQIQIQTLTSGAATDRTFFWIPADEAGDYEMQEAGWFDVDEWAPAANVKFGDGEGFLTSNDYGDGATITFAGQVSSGSTVFPIAENYSVAGNASPVAIDINDMVVSGEGIGAGQIQIQTLTSGAATDRTFFWIPADEAGDYEMEDEGWFDVDEWAPAANVEFAAGEGFLLSNDFGEGATLTIPSPL